MAVSSLTIPRKVSAPPAASAAAPHPRRSRARNAVRGRASERAGDFLEAERDLGQPGAQADNRARAGIAGRRRAAARQSSGRAAGSSGSRSSRGRGRPRSPAARWSRSWSPRATARARREARPRRPAGRAQRDERPAGRPRPTVCAATAGRGPSVQTSMPPRPNQRRDADHRDTDARAATPPAQRRDGGHRPTAIRPALGAPRPRPIARTGRRPRVVLSSSSRPRQTRRGPPPARPRRGR